MMKNFLENVTWIIAIKMNTFYRCIIILLVMMSKVMISTASFASNDFDVDKFIEGLRGMPDITFQIAEIRNRWNTLSDYEKSRLSQFYIPYPLADTRKSSYLLWKLSELDTQIIGAKTLITDHFRIIWGANYIDCDNINKSSVSYALGYWSDKDKDGYPTFVELMAGTDPDNANDPSPYSDFSDGICEYVWNMIVNVMGFMAPPGSEEHYIDIYIANTCVKNYAVETNDPVEGISLPDQVYGLTNTYQNDIPYICLLYTSDAADE